MTDMYAFMQKISGEWCFLGRPMEGDQGREKLINMMDRFFNPKNEMQVVKLEIVHSSLEKK